MQGFQGKVAVVTGGASGVGRALAQRLAGEGARVVIADIDQEAIDRVRAELDALLADPIRSALYVWILTTSMKPEAERGYLDNRRMADFFERKGVDGLAAVLGVARVLGELVHRHSGLLLITGPTGSGKTSTFNSLLDIINTELPRKIITIEDPVEMMFEDEQCVVEQREVGLDTMSFERALKSALREDPDMVLVGEMRDAISIGAAMRAAGSGAVSGQRLPRAVGASHRAAVLVDCVLAQETTA